jgi:hypothetical protein
MSKQRASGAELLSRAHGVLLDDLEQLEEAARSLTNDASAPFAAHLRRVQRHVMEHFRFEERDGYMSQVRKREPHLDREINDLLREHRDLAHTLSAIIEQAGHGPAAALAEQVRDWVARVRVHESHENTLVEEVFNRDSVAGD